VSDRPRTHDASDEDLDRIFGADDKNSRITLTTDEDLERDFGPGRVVIGFPVRPPVDERQKGEQSAAEDD
jgi:hypothetical protein